MSDKIIVSVICTVYNHEKYLEKCLDGILKQKTTFNYEVLVHDDASTDGSAAILKKYVAKFPDIIVPIFQKKNVYSQGINPTHIMLKMARGKYIAICEGDDFWIDPDKLQKQVNFLEKHVDYSLCVHAAYYAHENGTIDAKKVFKAYKMDRSVGTDEILDGWKFATNSIVYRKSAREDPIIPFQMDCENGDFAMAVYLSLNGKVYYMKDIMSAYRVDSVGSLNWKWKRNTEQFVQSKKRFIEMLYRIDSYTQNNYHAIIEKNIRAMKFSVFYASGDLKNARTMKDLYNQLNILQKAKLFLQYHFPRIYSETRKIIN